MSEMIEKNIVKYNEIINRDNALDVLQQKIHIHDYFFEHLQFDYSENILTVSLQSFEKSPRPACIRFYNVIGVKMSCCDFWGETKRIDCWYVEEEQGSVLLNDLVKERDLHNYDLSRLKDENKFFESTISVLSGDKVTVVCEYAIYEET